MSEYRNPEVFKVNGDKDFTITVVISAAANASDRTIMLNAAEALKFRADNNKFKSWLRRIVVK